MAGKTKSSSSKAKKDAKPKSKNTNLGLGSLKGAGNAKNRKARMDAYLSDVTGDSKPKGKKKK